MNAKKCGAQLNAAQKLVSVLETRVANQQVQLREAKAKAKAAKLEFKQSRKAAKRAKQLLCETQEKLEQQDQVVAKAKKRYGKALKKLAPKATGTSLSLPRGGARKRAKKVPSRHPGAAALKRKNRQPATPQNPIASLFGLGAAPS